MEIVFADLVHSGHTCNSVPYGSALVAAYAIAEIGPEISVFLVKKPGDIEQYFATRPPGIVCFSSYLWNEELSAEIARRIKDRFRSCITVFGGPNYPVSAAEQQSFLLNHPEIDFFIFREGEEAFVRLYRELKAFGFDAAALKGAGHRVPGCHYCLADVLIAGDELPLLPLDKVPSPYLSGLCDRFLQDGYTPILQTTRGCPFVCAYCQEGDKYFNTIRRYNIEKTKKELWYIAQRVKARKLYIADSNFGMYAEDVEIAEELSKIQRQHEWPDFVDCISGKNNKPLVLKTAEKIKGGQFSAAIQSSDPKVLHNIKRENVSISDLVEIASAIDLYNRHSFSEIILALPGDTLDAHKKSACDLIDAGIHIVRSHQFIMLPGAELSSDCKRSKYGLRTMFRVIPNTSETYSLFGQCLTAPEIDEICVGSDTMTFEEYLECRCFDLSVEIYYNNGVFYELQQFLNQQGVTAASFVLRLHDSRHANDKLAKIYQGFLLDTQELWESRQELQLLLHDPVVMALYSAGELGRNEQLAYKAAAFFESMSDVIGHAYAIAADMLLATGKYGEEVAAYLEELKQFDLFRKAWPLAVDTRYTGLFRYDFMALHEQAFSTDPLGHRLANKIELEFFHSASHRDYIAAIQDELSSGLKGYVAVIGRNPKIKDYFRNVSRVGWQ